MQKNKLILAVCLLVLAGVFLSFRVVKPAFSKPQFDTKLMCSRDECAHTFVKKLPAGFRDFPVKCEKCGQTTAFMQGDCPVCGALYAFDHDHPLAKCPKCGAELSQ